MISKSFPGSSERTLSALDNPFSDSVHNATMAALNRLPTSREYSLVSQRSKINIGATDLKNPLAPWQDLFWALVNSNEFILNH